MIHEKDHTLTGIISYSLFGEDPENILVLSQVCSNVHYYLDWISKITGIQLAEC